jgi:hypothetical protein
MKPFRGLNLSSLKWEICGKYLNTGRHMPWERGELWTGGI